LKKYLNRLKSYDKDISGYFIQKYTSGPLFFYLIRITINTYYYIFDIGYQKDYGEKIMPPSRFTYYMILYLTCIIGTISMLMLLVFLFFGTINFIDLGFSEVFSMVFNICMCMVFFIQHSIMVRRPFRKWLGKFLSSDFHGALYTISSGIILLLLIIFWQRSSFINISMDGILAWIVRFFFIIAFIGFQWGVRALKYFDIFGVEPILIFLRGGEPKQQIPFTIRGPYCWVRHPLYFFCLLLIWMCPVISADRLVYNILWTIWIIIGSILEERDLVTVFEDEYREYQKKVPMIIPCTIRPAV